MAGKKKNSTPLEQEIHLCYICGKEIYGDHVYIKPRGELSCTYILSVCRERQQVN